MSYLSPKEKGSLVLLLLLGILSASYLRGISLQKEHLLTQLKNDAALATLNPFRTVEVEAKSVYVYDLRDNKELYARHADQALPLASLTKLMTALVVLENLEPTAVTTLDKESLALTGSIGMKVGEAFDRNSLLAIMLVDSSNDAAHAFAKRVGTIVATDGNPIGAFIDLMNKKAQALALAHTIFYDESGLDVSKEKPGAYGSAKDVSKLLAVAYNDYPEIFSITKEPEITVISNNKISHLITNTNTSIDRIANLEISKTGYTKLAGGNLAIVFNIEPEHPIAVVVLGSSVTGRFDDIVRLVESSIQYAQLQESAKIF
jgi:D-alanyl-D-alanine carboxypeptidase